MHSIQTITVHGVVTKAPVTHTVRIPFLLRARGATPLKDDPKIIITFPALANEVAHQVGVALDHVATVYSLPECKTVNKATIHFFIFVLNKRVFESKYFVCKIVQQRLPLQNVSGFNLKGKCIPVSTLNENPPQNIVDIDEIIVF